MDYSINDIGEIAYLFKKKLHKKKTWVDIFIIVE